MNVKDVVDYTIKKMRINVIIMVILFQILKLMHSSP